MRIFLIIYLVLTLAGPLTLLLSGNIGLFGDYRTANRDSVHIAPDPAQTPEAIIQIYSARAFNWRGLFSVHTWIVFKAENATQYTVLQVIGWRKFRGLPALSVAQDIPDRRWFNQDPHILIDLRGAKAAALIPDIMQAASQYPYANEYVTWPGPNSNTLPAEIARKVPELALAMPSNALGKDYVPISQFFTKAPSGTGYQLSLYGVLGILLARKEGLEINILGLVYGISPAQKALKLPGFGDIPIG